MNVSFTSFEEILSQIHRLSTHVNNLSDYRAHLPSEASPSGVVPEKLEDHIGLVNQTSLYLIEIHGLEPQINSLIASLVQTFNLRGEGAILVKELFLATIVFHDYGKLNENFQADPEKMSNSLFKKRNTPIGTRHSILSAYLFLNYYLQKVEQQDFEDNEKETLASLVCCFADPILKHHSPVLSISDLDPEITQELDGYVGALGMSRPALYWEMIREGKMGFQYELYGTQKVSEVFPLYALLKLNFSLLTAADYLATLSYNYGTALPGVEASDFYGVLSTEKKKEWYQNFKGSADYNKVALESPEKFTKTPLSEYAHPSKENLNHLRSRMLAEVIENLRKSAGSNLFYLKAPTGAGKTNISLAVAMELLQQDKRLKKVYYVFPFTTLISQTYKAVKKALNLSSKDMVELHSKAYRAGKEGEDDSYGNSWRNHMDYLFCNFPMVLLSHIRFFDVLKGSRKEANYLLHRMANSVVIIDELQSYSPKFWNHVNYFIFNYGRYFNIRFVVMSATLPEIGKLGGGQGSEKDQFVGLVKEPDAYFQNPNFGNRVKFNFELMDAEWSRKENPVEALANEIAVRAEDYSRAHQGNVKAIVEFITKKSAAAFMEAAQEHETLGQYKLLLLSGTILSPRRKEIVKKLKDDQWLEKHAKVLLVCTQVVEAGVDIDMDIGFKDHALLDSDEQLAGRVNRNATKDESVLYLFMLDKTGVIYKHDQRLEKQRNFDQEQKADILKSKNFDKFYEQVIAHYGADQKKDTGIWAGYQEHIKKLNFPEADREFMLIEDSTQAVFIPLTLPCSAFGHQELKRLKNLGILERDDEVDGELIFQAFENICLSKTRDFAFDRESRKSLQSLLSKFTINVYPKVAERLIYQEQAEFPMRFGYVYFESYASEEPNHIRYDYKRGLTVPEELRYEIL